MKKKMQKMKLKLFYPTCYHETTQVYRKVKRIVKRAAADFIPKFYNCSIFAKLAFFYFTHTYLQLLASFEVVPLTMHLLRITSSYRTTIFSCRNINNNSILPEIQSTLKLSKNVFHNCWRGAVWTKSQ